MLCNNRWMSSGRPLFIMEHTHNVHLSGSLDVCQQQKHLLALINFLNLKWDGVNRVGSKVIFSKTSSLWNNKYYETGYHRANTQSDTDTHTCTANPTISNMQVHDHSSMITMGTILPLSHCAKNPVVWQNSWVGHIIQGICVVPEQSRTIRLTHTQVHCLLQPVKNGCFQVWL